MSSFLLLSCLPPISLPSLPVCILLSQPIIHFCWHTPLSRTPSSCFTIGWVRSQNMEYKFVELLSCAFVAADEELVRAQVGVAGLPASPQM